jgi:hypothetical protein
METFKTTYPDLYLSPGSNERSCILFLGNLEKTELPVRQLVKTWNKVDYTLIQLTDGLATIKLSNGLILDHIAPYNSL